MMYDGRDIGRKLSTNFESEAQATMELLASMDRPDRKALATRARQIAKALGYSSAAPDGPISNPEGDTKSG